jgi:hypothetical protein
MLSLFLHFHSTLTNYLVGRDHPLPQLPKLGANRTVIYRGADADNSSAQQRSVLAVAGANLLTAGQFGNLLLQ